MMDSNSLSNILSEANIQNTLALDTELYMLDDIEANDDGDLLSFKLSYVKLYPNRNGNGWQGHAGVKSRYSDNFDYLWVGKIKRDEFLDNFCLIEVLSTAILSTKYGENIQSYTELRSIFSKLSIADRLRSIKTLWPEDYPKGIGRLLNLRNQIAHSLEERRFSYGDKMRKVNVEFNKMVHKDMGSSLRYLLNILGAQQERIEHLRSELIKLR